VLSTSITRELTAQVLAPLDGPGEVEVGLRYDTADPYAVHAVFRVSVDQQISWVFARELLAQGMTEPSGDGDVRIWPTSHDGREVVCIVLRSPDGEALLQAPAVQLDEFLSAAYSICARGREARHLQIDRALVALFAS
jgi:Streptomyces sporulation and cell division protein, SsgA